MSYDDFEVDEETNEVLDEIAKEIDMKVKDMKKLKGLRCYLAGPIDHAEDDGVGWRTEAEKWFERQAAETAAE